jgi:hypothetical protein
MRRTPCWTLLCLPVGAALPEYIVGILIRAQSTRREAGVKHRTVTDISRRVDRPPEERVYVACRVYSRGVRFAERLSSPSARVALDTP